MAIQFSAVWDRNDFDSLASGDRTLQAWLAANFTGMDSADTERGWRLVLSHSSLLQVTTWERPRERIVDRPRHWTGYALGFHRKIVRISRFCA
jgi:hypothetical protein